MPAASLPCRPLCDGRTAFPFYAQRSFGSRKNNVGPTSSVLKTGLRASPGPVLAGRTAFWQSCFDVDSARKQGGFSLPPGGAGGGSGGWGGGSGGGGESSDDGGGYVLRGFGVAAASFFTLAKSIVCWCSGDPKATATDIDLGFLLSMAMLALVALAPTPLMLLRSVLVELTVAHIVLELFFYNWALQKIDPSAKYNMSVEMWLHHVAVAVGGAHLLWTGSAAGYAAFFWVGTQLIVTEITTFLPVAFHQAIKNKKMNGTRSVIVGVMMPVAFVLRSVLSFNVLTSYMRLVEIFGGIGSVPGWYVSASSASIILVLNVYWTGKILYGTTRFLSKRTKKAAADAAPASDNRAAVYSEQTTAVYQEASPVYSEVTEAVTPRKNAKKKK